MGEVVERIRAKVTRAKQHVQDFQLGLRAFYDTTPYEVRTKEDQQTRERIYYVARFDPLPYGLAAIAADVLQNLRSALDQIAYQLVLDARGGAEPEWLVQYPICPTATDYKATRSGQIKGVRQAAIDAIDATEPYKGGKGHALWQLHHLNRTDKHRMLVGTATVEDGVDLISMLQEAVGDKWPPTFMEAMGRLRPVFVRAAESPPLGIGDVVRREPIDTKVDEKRRFSFAITLHAPGIIEREPALKPLQDMASLVDAIIAELGEFLS